MVDERIEERGLWESFHRHLVVEIFEQLRDQLGDAYLVDFDPTIYLIPRPAGQARPVSPDVAVTLLAPEPSPAQGLTPAPALVEADDVLEEFEQLAIHVRRRDMPDPGDPFRSQVVSVVEVASPSNKGLFGAADRRKFLAKRHDYLSSPVSYTEIDLLREGERDLPQAVEQLEEHSFMVWSSQVQNHLRHHWGWGWEPAEVIPVVVLPLDYPRVFALDLGACYRQAFERNRWALRLE
ncbi:MAG: DUF4058 family protein [Chloroflexi bacterium]|nr:DUF4058 family protein [Chloroflexota bacterium]MCI0579976.1 DUF4058 family protein [Chloroflexota bacterium]MCI0647492.1 DUF4058 family protein [Chloroflexota bacterium]MCI0728719.1 DUF4058 family protein [Chloroflexota bacterium]